jgi:hypothetical protein
MKENYIDKMFEEDLPFGKILHNKQALHYTIVFMGNIMDPNEVRCLLNLHWNEDYKFDHMMKYEDTINSHMHKFFNNPIFIQTTICDERCENCNFNVNNNPSFK